MAAVTAPLQTLTTRPVDVTAEIEELNGDLGAEATVSLRWGLSLLASQHVSVAARSRVEVTFAGVPLPEPVLVELTVEVDEITPAEFDETNDARSTSVDVSGHELDPSRLVVPSLGGYGAQLNQHEYAAITPAPPGSLPSLEEKVKALEPQLVRIFFNEQQEAAADKMASFIETVELRPAVRSGDRHHLSDGGTGKARPRRVHGPVRDRARRARARPGADECPLGHGPERAEHHRRHAPAVRGALPGTGRSAEGARNR